MNDEHCKIIKRNAERFAYDATTGKLSWRDNYGPRARKGNPAGSVDSSGYLQVKLNGKCILVHRIIWYILHKEFPEQIDHKDRNRLNNREDNLRAANNTINQQNASKRKDNTSGQTGVTFRRGKWIVRIQANKVRVEVGRFSSYETAVAAYLAAKENQHIST